MDTRNAAADHIGLQTIDRNVLHDRWPCVSHPPEVDCETALRTFGKRGFRSLPPQVRTPARDWTDR